MGVRAAGQISGDFGTASKLQQLDRVHQRTGKPEAITRKIDAQRFHFYDGIALVSETDRAATEDGTFAFQSTEVLVHRGSSWKLVHLYYPRLNDKH